MGNHQWYVTSQRYRWGSECGSVCRVPDHVLHAKIAGTSTTACGLPCATWPKFWHIRYPLGTPGSCADCDAALNSRRDLHRVR